MWNLYILNFSLKCSGFLKVSKAGNLWSTDSVLFEFILWIWCSNLCFNNCSFSFQIFQDIQVALRDEIKSACEYRPFEKCDYGSRIANEICHRKVEFIMSQLDAMKQTIDEYHSAVWKCSLVSCRRLGYHPIINLLGMLVTSECVVFGEVIVTFGKWFTFSNQVVIMISATSMITIDLVLIRPQIFPCIFLATLNIIFCDLINLV